MYKKQLTTVVFSILIVGLTTVEGAFSFRTYVDGSAYNAVSIIGTPEPDYSVYIWCVGDNGLIYKYTSYGNNLTGPVLYTLPEGSQYNLTGVAFPRYDVGYIVGYKNSGQDRLKGTVWVTRDGGTTWSNPITPIVEPEVNVPFINVHAPNYLSPQVAWISCGYGYLLYTQNFGNTWTVSTKPHGDDNFEWLWGLWSDGDHVWICSDESRLIAKSVNGGASWNNYFPLADDSLAYRNLPSAAQENIGLFIASSKGKVVQVNQWGYVLDNFQPYGSQCQWPRGVAWDPNFIYSAGSGGTFASREHLLWYTRRCDFNDAERYIRGSWTYRAAVGTNSSILVQSEGGDELEDTLNEGTELNDIQNFEAHDIQDDQGWGVSGSWSQFPGASYYQIYAYPLPERDLARAEPPAYLSYWLLKNTQFFTFTYDSILTGYPTKFWIRALNANGSVISNLTGPVYCTPTDDVGPPKITGLGGYYDSHLNAAVIYWNPISSLSEPNLGGYWVCPEIYPAEYNINHPAPLYRNYYAAKPPSWAYGHNWGFWVQAMDRSGHRGLWSESVLVYVPEKPATSPYATSFNQGKHLIRTPNSKEIFTTYESNGKIYLSLTGDEGENWETEEIDQGFYPCVGLNYRGLPWIAYTMDGDLFCKMKRADGSWKEILIFDGDERHWAGPPSMQLATMPIEEDVIDYAYIAYAVYDGKISENPGPQPPSEIEHSYIYVSLFDTTGIDIVTHLIDEGNADIPLSHPCVSVTPSDLIHIVWQQKGEIIYITNTEKVTPENWREVEWTPKYSLSNTADISEHPFVESYGDIVSVVWKEGECGEILRKQRYAWEPSEYEKWEGPDNLSNSPEFNSDFPQMSTREVIVWQEQDEQGNYKAYANICGEAICLTPEANNISYVHTNVLIEDPQAPQITVYYCYTDEITEGELYEVKFDKYEFPSEPGEGEEVKYYEGKLGEELASAYCEQRTGYVDYNNHKIDYGNNYLKYKLKYLNPCKKYLFQGILYQCTTATIQQKLEVEDTLASDNTISYAIPETISFFIRKNSYKEDLESKIKLNKIQGAYSVLAKFKLYEYEEIDTIGGGLGPQSAGLDRLPIPTMLHSPKPNPFNNRTEIRFQIPARTNVDLKVYNSIGRLVNTLASSEMNPGYYTMSWNGKDNQNRTQSKGIYFVRLKTKDYDETKKIIMVR